ncbi:Ankyrin repeat-containing protein BDA1 [Linum grandiflorum]
MFFMRPLSEPIRVRFVVTDAMASIMNFCSIVFTMSINQFLPSAFRLSSLNFRQYCSFSYIGADFLQEVLKQNPSAAKEADEYGWIPLHYAAYLGNAEVVELFLQFDSSLAYVKDKCGMAALHLSAKAGHVNVAQKLTVICPDTSELLDNHYRTALHVAAENGKRSVVSYFQTEQVYWDLMNEEDEVGNTPLHSAAVQGHSEIVLLLANDPRVNKGALNKAGFTASDIITTSTLFKQHEKVRYFTLYQLVAMFLLLVSLGRNDLTFLKIIHTMQYNISNLWKWPLMNVETDCVEAEGKGCIKKLGSSMQYSRNRIKGTS